MQMFTYCNHNMQGDESSVDPTDALDVHILERQMECIQLTYVDLCKGRILDNAGGQGKQLRVVMQKLDSLGYIQGCCGFLTDPE